jgi:hypothetical protein
LQFRATRGLRPLDPAKGKRKKNKESVKVLGETKTDVVVPEVGGEPVAERRANVPRFDEPRAAPQHAPAAIAVVDLKPA